MKALRVTATLLTILFLAMLIPTPANAVSPIDTRYNSDATLRATLGHEVGNEWNLETPQDALIAVIQNYEHGIIWYNQSRGAHWMNSQIAGQWELNAYPELYLPHGDQHPVANGQAIDTDGGSIYWSTSTGAHTVFNGLYGLDQAIDDKYDSLGGAGGLLGLPTQEMHALPVDATPEGIGQRFQWGMIFQKGEDSGVAHEVHGAILTRYFDEDCVRGDLGWPTSDEQTTSSGKTSHFEHGSITWNSSNGHTSVQLTD